MTAISLTLAILTASVVRAPPAAIVASPEILSNIASSKLEKVIFFSVPPSEKMKLSPCSIPVPPKAASSSISTLRTFPVIAKPAPATASWPGAEN